MLDIACDICKELFSWSRILKGAVLINSIIFIYFRRPRLFDNSLIVDVISLYIDCRIYFVCNLLLRWFCCRSIHIINF